MSNSTTIENAELILRQAGARGMTAKELAVACGRHHVTAAHMLAEMCRTGKAASELDVRRGKSQPFRYWAAGFPAIKQPVIVSKKYAYELARVGKAPKPKAPAPVYEPIITSATKVTICPVGKDHRFTVHQPQRCFSGLPPGTYLPADTWASRAYA